MHKAKPKARRIEEIVRWTSMYVGKLPVDPGVREVLGQVGRFSNAQTAQSKGTWENGQRTTAATATKAGISHQCRLVQVATGFAS